ncbi:hypothetical protein HPB52_011727 [Rhipicephalus sanguineus]|uniref:Mediator of RNA polymerase II transcription subunit 30 n=1 Tax=Rhipicephalus sanguineus TaxID=34632 RepID=A0A9D4T3V4_RHISA|nr:hypothetical protein HPB52_011727 [Rhipicephalus sanguineus]
MSASISVNVMLPLYTDDSVISARVSSELVGCVGAGSSFSVPESESSQVVLKNRQLKEVIDALRNIIWEINTMLAMRKRHLQFTHRISSQAK